MNSVPILAQDSTGNQITLVVIGLLLGALALAFLTVWYYRITDPGPKPKSTKSKTNAAKSGKPQGRGNGGGGTRTETKGSVRPGGGNSVPPAPSRGVADQPVRAEASLPPVVEPQASPQRVGKVFDLDLDEPELEVPELTRMPARNVSPPVPVKPDGMSFDDWLTAIEETEGS